MSNEIERELEACLPRLFGYAMTLASDRELARDLLHDCAVKALAATNPPADRPALRAWLFRILRNAWIDARRREMRAPFETGEPQELPDGEYWRGDERLIDQITVKQALERLSLAHREVIALVDFAGFTYDEVATILDMPAGTVMSRLARGRKALLVALGDNNIRAFRVSRRSRT
jgi:RNA polymerase sigma-70 factor (ECF subfamily)